MKRFLPTNPSKQQDSEVVLLGLRPVRPQGCIQGPAAKLQSSAHPLERLVPGADVVADEVVQGLARTLAVCIRVADVWQKKFMVSNASSRDANSREEFLPTYSDRCPWLA